jgi:hypothetical protein
MYKTFDTLVTPNSYLNLPVLNNDPLTYCISNNQTQKFNHGSTSSTFGQNSRNCQIYLADRCSRQWDDICTYITDSYTTFENSVVPNNVLGDNSVNNINLKPHENTLLNIAKNKYRKQTKYCHYKAESFDPNSPATGNIGYYYGPNCSFVYDINVNEIERDVVMNKILKNAHLYKNFLQKLKTDITNNGKIEQIKHTKLFYHLNNL